MIVFMFLSLLHCTLNIFGTGKLVNHGDDGLEILVNFQFNGHERAVKVAKG